MAAAHDAKNPSRRIGQAENGLLPTLLPLLQIIGVILIAGYTATSMLQLGLGRDQERRQLRAYLGVDKIEVECCDIDIQGKFGFETRNGIKIFVKNSGQTPASDVRVKIGEAEYPFGSPYPANYNLDLPSISGPPATYPFAGTSMYMLSGQIRFFKQPIPGPTQIMRIQNRISQGLIFGYIEFTDIFYARHTIDFCRMYTVDVDGAVEFGECPQHNGEEPTPERWYSWFLPY